MRGVSSVTRSEGTFGGENTAGGRGERTRQADRQQAVFATIMVGLLVVSTVAALLAGVTPVAAQNAEGPVEGSVDLGVDAQDDEFETGTEQTVDLVISNDGEVLTDGTHPEEIRDRVTRAESTDVNITDSPEEIDVRTDEQSAGDIDSGDTVIESFDIFIDDDAASGEYELEVTTTYNNVTVTEYEQNEDGEVTAISEDRDNESETFDVTIEVEPEPAFEIESTDASLQIDDTGEFVVELQNVGGEAAEDVVVTAESSDQDIFFGSGGPTSEREVGDWESDETNELRYRIGATDDAVTESYPIDLTVEFTDGAGEGGTETLQTSVEPLDRQQYVVTETEHNVSIGDDGILDIDLENAGPQDLTNASVTVSTGDPAITFPEADGDATTATTFVDGWAAGETESLSVRTAVGSDAIERNYTLEVSIDARDGDDNELNDRTREFGFEPEPAQAYSVVDVSHALSVGDDSVAEIVLRNDGPQNVTDGTVTLSSGDSALTFEDGTTTTTVSVGDWNVTEERTVSTRVVASDDAVATDYTIEAAIDAADTNDSDLSTRTEEFGLEPLPRQQYTVEGTSHNVAINDNGVLELEMTNEGPLNLTDASVEVGTNDGAIVFGSGGAGDAVQFDDVAFETDGGGAPTSEAFVGEWGVGETKTLRYRVGATEDALARNYTLEATVDARNERDEAVTDRTRDFGFEPHGEQTFAIDNTENTLRVGEDGTVEGTITNTGDQPTEGTAVLLNVESENVLPRETQFAIGTLEPGETADFEFRIGMSEEAEAGPRLFEFETRYRNHDDDVRIDSSQDLFVDVLPDRDAFLAEPVDATLTPGGGETIELDLTNNLDEPVTNVRAKIFPDSPLDSDDDEAFVSALGPGETTTVVFDLRVDSGTVTKEYPLSIDIRYNDERGDSQLAGTYDVAVTVEESDESGVSLRLIGAVLLVVGVVAVYFRERLGEGVSNLAASVRGE